MATNDYAIVEISSGGEQTNNAANQSVVSTYAMENGFIFALDTLSSVAGNGAVFVATTPATGNLSNLSMLVEPPVSKIAGRKGLSKDPREFRLEIAEVGSAKQLEVGDIVKLSATAVTGTAAAYLVATNASNVLNYSASVISGLTLKVIDASDYFSLADGAAIGTQRVAAIKAKVVAVA